MELDKMTDLAAIAVAEKQPIEKMEFHLADNIFVKIIAIDKGGWIVKGHKHTFDHTSFLFKGSFRMWRDGKLDRDYHAPCGVLVQAGVEHSMLTLEDGTSFGCIHNTHGFPDDELEEHLIQREIPA